jgi:hypothetical protein
MLFSPSHPGEVLKDYLGDMTVQEAAKRLGVTRPNLSRILNARRHLCGDEHAPCQGNALHDSRVLVEDAAQSRSLEGPEKQAAEDPAFSESGGNGVRLGL